MFHGLQENITFLKDAEVEQGGKTEVILIEGTEKN